MPKNKLALNINLLKPQSNPEKLPIKFLHWLLSSGRYLFVAVNCLVLIAFIARFKLDADLATNKEAIDEQIPYLESLKPYEILIRDTQLKILTMQNVKKSTLDYSTFFKKIASQTPSTLTITSINIEKDTDSAKLFIGAQTKFNSDINNFLNGLKQEKIFSNVSIANVGWEQGMIKFTVTAIARKV